MIPKIGVGTAPPQFKVPAAPTIMGVSQTISNPGSVATYTAPAAPTGVSALQDQAAQIMNRRRLSQQLVNSLPVAPIDPFQRLVSAAGTGVRGPSTSFNTPSVGGSSLSKGQFALNVLKGLGIAPNAENTRAMLAWINAEGGNWNNSRHYNPLNTTQRAAGATYGGQQGNIASYQNWQQGLQATLETINNGRYGSIIQALKHGSAKDIARAVVNSPWGTSSLILRILGG